jgi:uridine phosphorylase
MGFPNFKNKHTEKPVFTPQEFLEYQRKSGKSFKLEVPEGVIFVYSNRLLNYILEHNKTRKLKDYFWNIGTFYTLNNTDPKIGVMAGFGVGAPVVVIQMEELIALGVKKFVSIGEAGTLQKNLKIGTTVVCQKAIRDEGTSYHYLKPSKYAYASKLLTQKIEIALQKKGKKYVVGTSWTIDAPYRETVVEARRYQKEGVAVVEMEASAMFAAAQFKKVDASAIFTVSDSLAELYWKPKFYLSNKNWEILFQVAKEALLN